MSRSLMGWSSIFRFFIIIIVHTYFIIVRLYNVNVKLIYEYSMLKFQTG
jgi:hypothetical protein